MDRGQGPTGQWTREEGAGGSLADRGVVQACTQIIRAAPAINVFNPTKVPPAPPTATANYKAVVWSLCGRVGGAACTVRLELGPNTPLIRPFSALQCALRAPSTAPSPPPCPRHMSPRTPARGFPGPPPPRPLGSTRPAGSASQLCVCGEPPHRRARSAFAAHRMVLPDLCGAYHRPPNHQHPHGKHYANYLVTEKSVSHRIQPKPPQVRAGPKTAVAARELQRREGHLVAAESWGDRASDRLGRLRCRWLDVRAPRQHP